MWQPVIKCTFRFIGFNIFLLYLIFIQDLPRRYNSSQSSTYVKIGTNFTISYGGGFSAAGFLSMEKVTLAGLAITNQTFAEATNPGFNFFDFGGISIDGIFGMGFPAGANSQSLPPFYNMFLQGLIAAPVFSMYFNALVAYILPIIDV